MSRLFRAFLAIALVLAVLFSTASAAGESSNDQSLFALLYDKITEIVTPRFDPTSLPTEVVLLEMPGLAINREEYDEAVWKARNYASRQPEAVAATFVDRLPAYTGVTFVDSGSRISTVWRHFMYQYIVPVIDDPAQVARVEAAKTALFNSTMQADFARNLDEYETELNAFENKREDCLSKKNAGFCSVGGVIWRERLRRKWFKMEVSRRTVADAEAKVLALQVGDLKVLMSEALENFASSERVDMGADGFGSTYYSTQLSPSNFWRWWPAASSTYDYKVVGGQTSTLNSTSPTASASSVTIVTQPSFGIITFNTATNAFAYTPQPSFTGSDTFSFSYNTSAPVTTVIVTKSILVQGGDVNVADSAFVGVSATQSASQSVRSSSYEKLTVDAKASFNYGMVKVSGSYKQSQFKSSSSFSSSGQQSSLAFELAKVRIIRPWLDTSLLSFYPIGIRGLRAGDWSDGTIKPAKQYEFKFKLLPTAFLVARNIKIQNSDWSQTKDAVQSSLDISASLQVSVGPFFSGSASTSYSTSKSDYRETASFDSNTLAIQGPQVIGWVCTPVPRFPNSDEDAVRKWEKDHATLSVTATKV